MTGADGVVTAVVGSGDADAYQRGFPSKSSGDGENCAVKEDIRLIMVDSVCRRNLARPCQVDSSKRSFRTMSSCFFGKSPSKTGIAHLLYMISIVNKC